MIQIVPAEERYAESFRECLDLVAREKRYLAQIEALPLERVVGFVRDGVADDAIQFFALDGETVVGWADIFPHWAPTLAHCGTLGMGVHPRHRGHGLGRRLLEACIDRAWRKGLTRIELEARVDNVRAIGLYSKLGFEREAVKARAMCFDGVYFDALQMRLLRNDVCSEGRVDVPAAGPCTESMPGDAAMHASLREITADTVRKVTDLSVRADQKHLVASNAESLAEALFAPEAWYRAIHAGDQLAGFVMLYDESLRSPAPDKPEVGVWRFMIDSRFQGSGIGKAAFQLVIDHVRAKGIFSRLQLSFVPGPGNPEGFYRGFGFRPTGEVDDGEVVLELDLAAQTPSSPTPP